MKVFWFKCLNCKEETQAINSRSLFEKGCPLCSSKRIKMLGYVKEMKK